MTDGFGTFVLTYANAEGAIFTHRVISNDPEFSGRLHDTKLSDLYQRWGLDLISVTRMDELPNEIQAPAAMANRTNWRLASVAMFVLLIGLVSIDLYHDVRTSHRLEARLQAIEAKEGVRQHEAQEIRGWPWSWLYRE